MARAEYTYAASQLDNVDLARLASDPLFFFVRSARTPKGGITIWSMEVRDDGEAKAIRHTFFKTQVSEIIRLSRMIRANKASSRLFRWSYDATRFLERIGASVATNPRWHGWFLTEKGHAIAEALVIEKTMAILASDR